ncbi:MULTISPECIES: hypothetical protein [Paraprevotella]|jgi:hypothetical protein|uniref:hypothetical protein n=1 Tax=Paraprevotella TaxID=577309 RepID=UPI00248FE386|nr:MULTISPECIES: hypothetical protein [Paraprevotella]BDI75658.1 hypothetical protein PC1C4_23800 [Paraprevotella clara]
MNRDLCARRLSKVIGKENVCRLQSKLKYFLSFRNEYKTLTNVNGGGKKIVIFFIDGKTIHGGLSDRLRGLFSTYYYCLKEGIDFKVFWTYPFNLQDYLEPNKVNWLIEGKAISHNKNEVAFRFFNSYSLMNNNETSFLKIMNTKKHEIHVYSNITLHEEMYHIFFNDLFKPSKMLSDALQYNTDKIGGKYISVSFRFIGILGDFKDTYFKKELGAEEKEKYISKCLDVICRLKTKHPNVPKILVTSDSRVFLEKASSLAYVYIIPGTVVHMDGVNKNMEQNDLKVFLDMLMISKAECCYSYSYGKMFKGTKFAKTSALIGNRRFIGITE